MNWYSITNKAGANDEAEITIYEEIGAFGISADQFVRDIKSITAKQINLRLNTPGGEVFAATAIHNAIREHPATVTVHIDGLAASAGSFIAMAGDEVRMASNAYLMIHQARGGIMGNADAMRKHAALLEKLDGNIAGMYQAQAGKTPEYWLGKMAAETWYTADEAKADGLVDVVTGPAVTQPTSQFDFKIYNKTPQKVREVWMNRTAQPTANTNPGKAGESSKRMNTTTTTTPEDAAFNAAVLSHFNSFVASEATNVEEIAKGNGAEAHAAALVIGMRLGMTFKSESELHTIGYTDPDKSMQILALREIASRQIAALNKPAPTTTTTAAPSALVSPADFQASCQRECGLEGNGLYNYTRERAKERAASEWDSNPAARKGFSTRERYILGRSAELDGSFRGVVQNSRAIHVFTADSVTGK